VQQVSYYFELTYKLFRNEWLLGSNLGICTFQVLAQYNEIDQANAVIVFNDLNAKYNIGLTYVFYGELGR